MIQQHHLFLECFRNPDLTYVGQLYKSNITEYQTNNHKYYNADVDIIDQDIVILSCHTKS